MDLIHNERIKLHANALDRLSTALLAVGVIGKVFNFAPTHTLAQALGMLGWFFAAGALHWMAYRLLRRLRP
jgi:hypothetical protein